MSVDRSHHDDTHTRRPPVKRRSIVAALRSQIVSGKLAPGAQLPTRMALMELHEASSITVQSALDRLVKDGFVVAQGRRGTFVAEHPPHLHRYGLVFAHEPTSPNFGRYAMALCGEARRLEQESDRRFTFYHSVNRHADSEAYHMLVSDIRAHRLAGLIFSVPPICLEYDLTGTPVLDAPGMPRVVACTGLSRVSFPMVSLSEETLCERAMDDLAARGRKRVACLCLTQVLDEQVEAMRAMAAARGLSMPARWVQAVDHTRAHWAGRLAQLLFDPNQAERPDALFIVDDTLVEPATAAMASMGLRVPRDVEIVAHANFPWATPCHLPAHRIGFDIRQVLSRCVESIDQQRRGLPTTAGVALACFDHELSGRRMDESVPAAPVSVATSSSASLAAAPIDVQPRPFASDATPS